MKVEKIPIVSSLETMRLTDGQDIALLASYRALAAGNAPARSSILYVTPPHPILALHLAISSGHYILVPVAFAAILSEVLTITLSTIPFSSANLWSTYVTSHWISIGIIGIMVCVLGLLFFYAESKLPLKPDTVAGQLFYLSGSGLPSFLKTLGMLE